MKRCCGCREIKPLDDFYVWKRGTDGRQVYCKACSRSSNAAWKKQHPDYERERLQRVAARKAGG